MNTDPEDRESCVALLLMRVVGTGAWSNGLIRGRTSNNVLIMYVCTINAKCNYPICSKRSTTLTVHCDLWPVKGASWYVSKIGQEAEGERREAEPRGGSIIRRKKMSRLQMCDKCVDFYTFLFVTFDGSEHIPRGWLYSVCLFRHGSSSRPNIGISLVYV